MQHCSEFSTLLTDSDMNEQPLHLGVTPWHVNSALGADDLCRQAEQAEAWGYDSFWLPESHLSGPQSLPEPMLLLAAVAARTRRIKLATTSYLLPIRHPLQAAEQVSVLDQLSGGRLILGLGRGFLPGMLEAFGVASGEKRQRFDQVLQAMQAAWRGETVGEQGTDLRLSPLPRQQPHPPLWVAAFGPKALGQAAGLGLPYLASPMETLDQLEQNFALFQREIQAAGHRLPEAVPIMRVVFTSRDPARCAHVRALIEDTPRPSLRPGATVPVEDARVDDWCLIGSPDEIQRQLAEYRQRLGINHLVAVRPRVAGIDSEWLEESMAVLADLPRGCL
jgi:alkanesulfonate monooxygenase SsuD/methylene tetrahydromethanopterin reductase-like flavin-dependent oxidoreductase (luciferase family)